MNADSDDELNDSQQCSTLLQEGIWKLPLDNASALEDSMQAFEQYHPTTAVDLIFTARGRNQMKLTHEHALKLASMLASRTDITWHELFLEVSSANPHYHYMLLKIVDMFPKICINHSACATRNISVETSYAVFHALEHGRKLKELHISYCICRNETVGIIGEGLQSRSCNLERLVFYSVSFDYQLAHNNGRDPLSAALSNNTSLKCLELRNTITADGDGLLAILSSIVKHPNLEVFALEGTNLGESILNTRLIRPVTRLLASSRCQLVSLDVSDCCLGYHSSGERHLLACLLNAIRRNHCLKSLDLSENGLDNMDVISILDCIRDCPNLRDVDLNGNDEVDQIHFGNSQLARPHPPTKLQQLDLQDYFREHYHGEAREDVMILQLLQHNPLLGDLGLDMEESQQRFSPEIVHLLDLNLFGRVLMLPISAPDDPDDPDDTTEEEGKTIIPLSIWPMVLERSNNIFANYPKREANVIFHLLNKGPLFFGR
jgi:hypothetical protein